MVTCWILNSMTAELAEAILYAQSAAELWKEITERYGQSNGSLIYHLQRELSNCCFTLKMTLMFLQPHLDSHPNTIPADETPMPSESSTISPDAEIPTPNNTSVPHSVPQPNVPLRRSSRTTNTPNWLKVFITPRTTANHVSRGPKYPLFSRTAFLFIKWESSVKRFIQTKMVGRNVNRATSPNAALIPLFAKLVTASDANLGNSRLIIPKDYVKAYFPAVSDYQKIPVNIVDTDGKEWDDIYFRCWPSRFSKTYVLTGLRAFIISKNMQKGDTGFSILCSFAMETADSIAATNNSLGSNAPDANSGSKTAPSSISLYYSITGLHLNPCSSLYKDGKFCEEFHLNEDGWQECEECARPIHCGCIVSLRDYSLNDFGGITCLKCIWADFKLEPSHFNTESDPIDITDLVNPEPVLVLLFEKVLTANDASRKHSYIIIPNKHAKVRPNDPKYLAFYQREPDGKIVLETRKPYAEIPTDHQLLLHYVLLYWHLDMVSFTAGVIAEMY
ncbi:DNA-binding pseudobarrel domain-containing protein [Artemisia annua]|uniref:DNA-binding pseudobarrel domain-containing protein n=1 Tax=Artemisia annua TaxID=35608 RepID=A0A2U1QCH8_ARTAN|nr:DNA-binding pseudobarrel domain-containing protein [Artemisia annua]